ncbi:MAG TPA: glycoside hydrolase family 27 protein [Puia sp.]
MITKLALVLSLAFSLPCQAQKFEGLALTPPMGWNSWNTFSTKIDEVLVKQIAEALVSSGMKKAGYTYVVLDDGWMERERDSVTGDLVADHVKFPGGMKALADYIHSLGLKFGLYNCAGTRTCAGYPGTRGYEYQDARLYASWGIDYLKFDFCHSEGINAREAYSTMSKALRKAGRPVVFSLCEWGTTQPWTWASGIGHLWRTTGDIGNVFDGIKKYRTWHENGVMTIVDMQDSLRKYAGPGHWNDPDMLEVGNGMTPAEDRAHFSIWCMLAAPLISGNDLRKMSAESLAILADSGAISVDQDPDGIQAFRYPEKDSVEVWFKPLQQGAWAACFLNRSSRSGKISFDWQKENVNDELNHRMLGKGAEVYKLYDVWGKKNRGTTARPLTATLASHDVLMLILRQ